MNSGIRKGESPSKDERNRQMGAKERYDAKNTKQFKMKLNIKTDADIIKWLEAQDNKQGAIKELIRKEMRK